VFFGREGLAIFVAALTCMSLFFVEFLTHITNLRAGMGRGTKTRTRGQGAQARAAEKYFGKGKKGKGKGKGKNKDKSSTHRALGVPRIC
jgi:hypothetical protein